MALAGSESVVRQLPPADLTEPVRTLVVGLDVTLELSEDSLVIHGDDSIEPEGLKCCGLQISTPRSQPTGSPTTTAHRRVIAKSDILWGEIVGNQLVIRFAKYSSKSRVQPTSLAYTLEKPDDSSVQAFVSTLMNLAYGQAQRKKRIKVLINPFGGTGKAQQLYYREIAPIFTEAQCQLDVQITQYQGHAKEIAKDLDIENWDVIACCSGDGTPHEVFNGLALQGKPLLALRKIAVVQLPCGSGNAMCVNTTGQTSCSLAAVAVVKGLPTPLDLISITQGQERTLSFLSQSLGIIAESDLATENLRWLGSKRFEVGFAMRAFGKKIWPCDIAVGVQIEDKAEIRRHYAGFAQKEPLLSPVATKSEMPDDNHALPELKFGTVSDSLPEQWSLQPFPNLGNFYCGNMAYMTGDANFFPAALPSDGCMDLVTIRGDISGFRSISLADKVGKHKLYDDELVQYRKVVGYRVVPHGTDGYISIDGERIPWAPFQAEVHRGLGCVLSKSGKLYEARGP